MDTTLQKERRRIYWRRYYYKNRERLKNRNSSSYQREYYIKNREKVLARMKRQRSTPDAQVKNRRWHAEWYAKNRELKLEQNREWRRKNPEHYNLLSRRARARKLNAAGKHTVEEWLWLKQVYENTCLRCFRKEPEIKLTVDHKVPLSLGGTNYIDNIQPLCSTCNASKNATVWFASCPVDKSLYIACLSGLVKLKFLAILKARKEQLTHV